MRLTNNSNRALGIPSAHGSIILQKGESANISPLDLKAIERNKTSSGWLHHGIISVDGSKAKVKKEAKKEEKEPVKTEDGGEPNIIDHGRGWFTVEVAGIEVSQGKLRKDDAEALAAKYKDED